MRFALLVTAAAFVVAPAISQPFHTEHVDYRVGVFPADQGLEIHTDDASLLSVTGTSATHTGYRPSARNSTIVEHGLGSREVADLRTGENATSYTAFVLNLGSTSTGNAGMEDQQHGTGEYDAIGFAQSRGTAPVEQSHAFAAGMSWGMSLILVVAVLVMALSVLK